MADGRAHPIALLFAGLLVGGWVLLRLITPEAVSFEAIEAGQCLYVRTGSAASLDASQRPIGTPELVRGGAPRRRTSRHRSQPRVAGRRVGVIEADILYCWRSGRARLAHEARVRARVLRAGPR